jgi:hypothetical protein
MEGVGWCTLRAVTASFGRRRLDAWLATISNRNG